MQQKKWNALYCSFIRFSLKIGPDVNLCSLGNVLCCCECSQLSIWIFFCFFLLLHSTNAHLNVGVLLKICSIFRRNIRQKIVCGILELIIRRTCRQLSEKHPPNVSFGNILQKNIDVFCEMRFYWWSFDFQLIHCWIRTSSIDKLKWILLWG